MNKTIYALMLGTITLLAGCSNTTYVRPQEDCRKFVGVFIPIEDCTRPNQPIRGAQNTEPMDEPSGAVNVE